MRLRITLLPLLLLLHTRLYSLRPGLPSTRRVVDNNYSDGSPPAICRRCNHASNSSDRKHTSCSHPCTEGFSCKTHLKKQKKKNESNRFVCDVRPHYVNIWTAYISITKLHTENHWYGQWGGRNRGRAEDGCSNANILMG